MSCRTNSRGRVIVEPLESRTLFNAGVLDPSFAPPSLKLGVTTAVAADANGKILVGGVPRVSGAVGLERLLPNGSLDTSFGSDGQVKFGFAGTDTAVITGIAIQPDGKIVVSGLYGSTAGEYFNRQPDNQLPFNTSNDTPFIARLNPSGTLDTTFGTGGEVTAVFGNISGVAVLPSGKIIYGGNAGAYAQIDVLEAVRLNANGKVDTTYGVHGVASPSTPNVGTFGSAQGFNVESDGDVVISSTGTVVRYTAAGKTDYTFGTGRDVYGEKIPLGELFPVPVYGQLLASDVQADGKIIIDFATSGGSNLLERFNVNGSVDTTFGVKGVAATPYGVFSGGAIVIDSEGRILVAGAGTSALSVTRYESNGALDTSFGTDGSTSTDGDTGNSGFYSAAMTLQSSGRIVVVGNVPDGFEQPPEALITRFLGTHVTLTAGTSAVTTGTTNVADPRLLGHVIASQTLNFTFGSGLSAVTGQLQEWVEKETVSGTLDFYFRIVTDSGSAAGISSLLASGFSGFQTYVDYRPDSSGTIAPVTASRSTDDKSVTFNFLASPSGGGLVTAGKSSYALFIKTDATHFNKLGKVVLNNTIDLNGFQPIG